MDDKLVPLIQLSKLWSRAEILADPCPVPDSPGVYAWFFKEIPPGIPVARPAGWDRPQIQRQGLTLLYVGISPMKELYKGEPSKGHIRSRICYHMGKRGSENAEGSTLRMSLGCLLGIRLGKPGGAFTFGPDGEATLSTWLERNAYVSWVLHSEPWKLEDRLIGNLDLPLNLKGNSGHPFCKPLKGIRKKAKAAARRRDA